MQAYIFEMQQLTCGYGKKNICQNLSLQLQKGSCNLILGENGCGKSTLFSVITNMKRAKEGIFLWEGQEQPIAKLQDKIGYVPQFNPLIPELTVRDNLLFWYRNRHTLEMELKSGILRELELEPLLPLRANRLSGGMARRCVIGCAMAGNPLLLVMDEPGAALDATCKKMWRKCMKRYLSEGGTVLFSSHDEMDYEAADHIYKMENGVLKEISLSRKERL